MQFVADLADAFRVEVWEFFKGASDQEIPIVDRISEDFAKHVNLAMEMVHKQYKPL